MKQTKRFSTLAVAGVATGVVLEKGGFSGIHEVMDHLFPGVMTMGVAAMSETASAEIYRQLPQLKSLVDSHSADARDWANFADSIVKEVGDTLPVEGPMSIERDEIAAAFEKLGT